MRVNTRLQFGPEVSPSRPACTAQLTGLYFATLCIQPGISAWAMKTELRKVSGNSTKLLTAIIVSSRRESSATPLLSAPIPVPSSTEQIVSATMPAMPPGYLAPMIRPSTMMIADWITPTRAPWTSRPAMSEPRLTGLTRKRSTTPRSRSSIRLIPLQPALNRQVITTMPGVRKSM